MNKGYNKFPRQKNIFRRPPQVKSSKAQIHAKYHKIPTFRFEDQQLTSFSGLLIFHLLFKRIDLKNKLKSCFSHVTKSPSFKQHLIVMLLVFHLILGFKRLEAHVSIWDFCWKPKASTGILKTQFRQNLGTPTYRIYGFFSLRFFFNSSVTRLPKITDSRYFSLTRYQTKNRIV